MISLFSVICKFVVTAVLIFLSIWFGLTRSVCLVQSVSQELLGIADFKNVFEMIGLICFNIFYISQGCDLDRIVFIVNINARS